MGWVGPNQERVVIDLYQSIRERAYELAETRSKELGVPLDHYIAWQNLKPAPDVDAAMIRETDDKASMEALRR